MVENEDAVMRYLADQVMAAIGGGASTQMTRLQRGGDGDSVGRGWRGRESVCAHALTRAVDRWDRSGLVAMRGQIQCAENIHRKPQPARPSAGRITSSVQAPQQALYSIFFVGLKT